jgi:hypothetical protein
MAKSAPKIDSRTAETIVKEVESLLAEYSPQAFRRHPETGQAKPLQGFNAALVNIFARYCEIIIQRLNQVPNKNLLAFLDLLGASRLPPQPARAPLTFTLAAGSAVDAIVPARTQVAAPPVPGQDEPIIFETERELMVTDTELAYMFNRDPQSDRFANLSHLTQSAASEPVPVFEGVEAIEHMLYIGEDTFLGFPDLQLLTLKFELQPMQIPANQSIDPRSVQWEVWQGDTGIPILPPNVGLSRTERSKPKITTDFTKNLTTNGAILFENLPLIPQQTIAGITSRWLRCRLTTRITKSATQQSDRVRESQLPTIKKLTFQATVGKIGHAIAYAFTNQIPIDLTKPFYPFGDKPKFGDTLYLGSEAFSKEGANVTLHVDLADLEALGLALPKAIQKSAIEVELIWEVWTGGGWQQVGKSDQTGPTAPFSPPTVKFQDLTKALIEVGPDKLVRFQLPKDPDPELEPTTINGIESYWIRVRIANGNYGKEGSYVEVEKTSENPSGFKFTSPTFRPPMIPAIKVDYSLVTSDNELPNYIVSDNDFKYLKIESNQEFKPFTAIPNALPTLHLGFGLPPSRNELPDRPLSLYLKLAESVYQPQPVSASASLRLVWDYWNGKNQAWEALTVQDGTKALTRAGLVEFLPPPEFALSHDFKLDKPYYWLRVRWQLEVNQALPESPELVRVLLNTVTATQTVTMQNEILGSSDGSEQQIFYTTKAPVLPNQHLDVREMEEPSADERIVIEREEGSTAIAITRDPITGQSQEVWVRWHEVPDFYGSGPRDRHYVLNPLTGEIRFGNGINGKIPPTGTGNLRMTRYHTGGGTQGNCSEGRIMQLKTTIPYIDSVTNPEAATGGADAESIESLCDRAPRRIRHGDRAVTLEDYEDLAMLTSPEVARARCFPLLNLRQTPFAGQNPVEQVPRAIGAVSVMILPRSTQPKPIPSLELINRVQDYLEAHSIPTATIAVVGPLYMKVSVTAIVALTSLEGINLVEQSIQQSLTSFLHPLTGGSDGTGWAFGREPSASDFYALLESVSGVDHVRSLSFEVKPDQDDPNLRSTNRFLVYSGVHKITFESN